MTHGRKRDLVRGQGPGLPLQGAGSEVGWEAGASMLHARALPPSGSDVPVVCVLFLRGQRAERLAGLEPLARSLRDDSAARRIFEKRACRLHLGRHALYPERYYMASRLIDLQGQRAMVQRITEGCVGVSNARVAKAGPSGRQTGGADAVRRPLLLSAAQSAIFLSAKGAFRPRMSLQLQGHALLSPEHQACVQGGAQALMHGRSRMP